MQEAFGAHLADVRVALEITSTETLKQAVIAGLGIGFLSAHTIAQELRTKSLVVLDVRGFPRVQKWYVVHRRQKRLPPVAQAFKAFLLEEGAGHAGPHHGAADARAGQFFGTAIGGGSGRSSSPVVETFSSSSPGSLTGTKVAEPYWASKKSASGRPAAERDEIDQRRRADRMDRARRGVLLLERAVAAGDAVEPVRGVQPEHVRERRPLDDVAVDVDVVAGERRRSGCGRRRRSASRRSAARRSARP